MRENSNKREVSKPTIKIHDSSASDAADPDHFGDEMQEGGRFGLKAFVRCIWRAGKSFYSPEKLGRVFSSQSWLV